MYRDVLAYGPTWFGRVKGVALRWLETQGPAPKRRSSVSVGDVWHDLERVGTRLECLASLRCANEIAPRMSDPFDDAGLTLCRPNDDRGRICECKNLSDPRHETDARALRQ